MTAPTTVVRITHSWCPTCQGGMNGKARCGTTRPVVLRTMRRGHPMTREIQPLPWQDPYRLWFAGAVFAAAIAASAVYGVISTITRSWPETFTTDDHDGR